MLEKVAEKCFNITQSYLSIETNSLINSAIIKQTQEAINITRKNLLGTIFERWNPFNGEISFSYNGGKDCQVLLILYLGCLWEFFLQGAKDSQYESKYHKFPIERLPTVYIDQPDSFKTAQEFLEQTVHRYCLSLYESDEDQKVQMSKAFETFLEMHPETKAILIGVRHSDPFGETLKVIQSTDPSWPQFIRLQPLLHWNLAEVWSFLLYSGEDICGLYGLGFTSLGSINATLRNPYLKITDKETNINHDASRHSNKFLWEIENNCNGDGKTHASKVSRSDLNSIEKDSSEQFYPGWYLTKDAWERAGRLAKRI